MELDIIIPAYNEEGNISNLYEQLKKTLKGIDYTLIFIDDGSKDKTFTEIESIYNKDNKRVKAISLSRNFGKDAAIYAGLEVSNAKNIALMDADLQHRPETLLEMLKMLNENSLIDEVAMVNNYKNNSKISAFLKRRFYKTMSKLSEQHFEAGASDFRMFRDYVREAVLNTKEKNRFTKGILSWVGFNIYYIPYTPDKRVIGQSKFKFKRQVSYAKEGVLNFSTKPLKIATILGTLISTGAFIYLLEIIIETMITGKSVPGYASLMCIILLLGGIQLIVLGIISDYIAKSYVEVKNRPIYLAKKKLGIKK